VGEVKIGEAQNGARLAARVGDTIVLRLPENAAGGYRWTLTPVDAGTLEMTEHHYEDTRAGVGSAGASVWTFTPRTAGHARLELRKVRPWNPRDAGGERFSVDLEIGGA
jgi:inhibitor of cysteine peptidase